MDLDTLLVVVDPVDVASAVALVDSETGEVEVPAEAVEPYHSLDDEVFLQSGTCGVAVEP